MSVFNDPKAEDKLCQVLKSVVEEWGPDKVVVHIPMSWKEYAESDRLGRVKLLMDTGNSVIIESPYGKYEIEVKV